MYNNTLQQKSTKLRLYFLKNNNLIWSDPIEEVCTISVQIHHMSIRKRL